MVGIVGTGSFVLAIIFAWSGIAKARRPVLAATAMRDFGLTRRVHVRLGRFLGLAEVVLAAALASTVAPVVSTGISALALWVFSGLVARGLLRGDSFPCFCFGDADAGLSRLALARTLALATLATLLTTLTALRGELAHGPEVTLLQAIMALAIVGTTVLVAKTFALVRSSPDTVPAR